MIPLDIQDKIASKKLPFPCDLQSLHIAFIVINHYKAI